VSSSRDEAVRPVIAVVGSVNVDLVTYAERVPGPGETVIGNRFAVSFGGKGANQAVMARRAGAEAWLIARVGDDAYGDLALADLVGEGVETRFVGHVAGPTGVAPIWVEADGTNRIIVIAGANGVWTQGAAQAAIAAIPSVAAVIGQLEIPQAVTAAAFRAARGRGAITILNPAPVAPLSAELLSATDWLIPNEAEFDGLAAPSPAASTFEERLTTYAAASGKRLIVTLGANGAVLVFPDGSLAHVAAPTVNVVDTTGAGDAFVGAFAHALASGLGELEAVAAANALAADSVTRAGARGSVTERGT
jgi:ribokinase